ncbi:MAG: MFS transporter [Desulfovibrio sp.]|uniref:MFS transporter n=1 Tax=Desulfovibrio sp. TaxID=885 RepID=UPI00135DEF8C|nr:MFS transporter [Desulfovibrio sp.]MTJ92098.1 MFS transporter [Desulfovibrio sp.]
MPQKRCRKQTARQASASFGESLAAICRGNFLVVTCINLLLMTDYYLIFVTGTAHVQKTFGVSLSVAGFSSGIMVIGCLAGRFVTGNQMSAIGGRLCLLAGLLLFAASIGALEFAHSLPLIFIQRFMAGFGVGVAGTATGAIVAYVVPVRFHGLGIGLFTMSAALALALGPFLGISLSLSYGYRTLMQLSGIVSLLCLGIFVFLRNLPPMHLRLRPVFSMNSYIDPRVVRFSLVALVVCPGYGCIQAFLPSFAAEHGLTGAASIFFLCYAGAALLTRPQTGRLFDTRGEHVVMYPALLITALALFVLSQAHSTAMLLCAGVLLGIGFANFQSVGQAVSLSLVSRSRYAQATTTFYIFFDLGIGLGPYVFGHAIPLAGYSGMYMALSALVVCGVGVYHLVHGRRPQ